MRCVNGHEADPTSTTCPVCGAAADAGSAEVVSVASASGRTVTTGRLAQGPVPSSPTSPRPALYGLAPESAAPRPNRHGIDSPVADGLFVAAGFMILASAFAQWIIATGPVPHVWIALHVGDTWTPAHRVSDNVSLFGIFVVLVGALFIALGLARFSSSTKVPGARARSVIALSGSVAAIIIMLVVVGNTVSYFDYSAYWNQVGGGGEVAGYGSGIWIFVGALVVGAVGGVVLFTAQRRSAPASAAASR
jgi:hypothetical protein